MADRDLHKSYYERPATAHRPRSGPNAHFYLYALEQLAAHTKTLTDFDPKDRAILVYALHSRAEQAGNKQKHGGRNGGLKGVGGVKSHRRLTLTRSQLLTALQDLARTLRRTPKYHDLTVHGLPCGRTYLERFGSYAEACRLAGLRPNTQVVTPSSRK